MGLFAKNSPKESEYPKGYPAEGTSSSEEPVGISSDGSILRPTAPKGTVFNRRTVMVIATALGLIIILGILYAFAPSKPQDMTAETMGQMQNEQSSSGGYTATPDELNQIPGSYKSNLSPDQNKPLENAQTAYDLPPYNPSIPLAPPQQQTQLIPLQPVANIASQETEEQKEMAAVRKSPIRFGNAANVKETENGPTSKESSYTDPNQLIKNWDDGLQDTIGKITGAISGGKSQAVTVTEDQNLQDEKRQFKNQNQGNAFYATSRLQAPQSPYEVKAGTVVPVTLITGINSDLPGNITAQVRENVYDTVSGRHLLIPQGTRVIGTYDSKVAYAQNRVLVVWSRLIFPNGNSLDLQNLSGVDGSGYSGLHDKVNNHYGKLFMGVFLTSILSAGAKMATDSNSSNPTYGELAGQGVAENVANVGTKLAEKNINIQPTLEIRPGFKFNLFVDKDFIIYPYVETRK